METAAVFAQRSTCSRASVGVVIARDGRILVTGYNGAPAGMDHCSHDCDCEGKPLSGALKYQAAWHDPRCMSLQPCRIAVHAEANAIAYAAKHGVSLDGAELHTTLCPCLPCAQLIVNAGIWRVVAAQPYRDQSGLDLLKKAGIALQ